MFRKTNNMNFLIAVAILASGCGKTDSPNAALPSGGGGKGAKGLSVEEARQGKVRFMKNTGEPVDDDSVYAWDEERIRARHAALLLVDLPDYAEGLAGGGGLPREAISYATWTFHIPAARIEEFKKYIVNLGVPDRCLAKAGMKERGSFPYAEPGWALPDPPATKLFFLRTDAQPGESTEKWIKGETMFYYLLNPNINYRSIEIMFSAQTGWVRVTEFHHHD